MVKAQEVCRLFAAALVLKILCQHMRLS